MMGLSSEVAKDQFACEHDSKACERNKKFYEKKQKELFNLIVSERYVGEDCLSVLCKGDPECLKVSKKIDLHREKVTQLIKDAQTAKVVKELVNPVKTPQPTEEQPQVTNQSKPPVVKLCTGPNQALVPCNTERLGTIPKLPTPGPSKAPAESGSTQ
jgi:hypothetical protein